MNDPPDPARPDDEGARARSRWFRARHEVMWLFLIALAVRAAAAWMNPAILNDSISLLRSADRFRSDGLSAAVTGPDHPLVPWLVSFVPAGIYSEVWATVLSVFAGAFAVWPLHVLARRACGRHAATAACIVYAALPKAIGVASVPLTSAVFLPLFLSGLSIAVASSLPTMKRRPWGREEGRWRRFFRVEARKRRTWRRIARLVGAGLVCGLAYLCRPEGLIAAAGAVAAVLALGRHERRWKSAAILTAAFLVVAAPYAIALSRQAGRLDLSPKKDVARFVGAADAPREAVADGESEGPIGAGPAAQGAASALESALTFPVILLVLVGCLRPTRWRHPRSIVPRAMLLAGAAVFVALVVRLRLGWGYGGARHILPGALLVLPFAGEAFLFLGAFISRVIARRRLAVVLASFLAIPLAVRSLLRPEGEDQVDARQLGETIAAAAKSARRTRVVIASFREPLVAYYADRELREVGAQARDLPLWGRYRGLLVRADADRSDLAAALRREGAQWVVLDLFRTAPDAAGVTQIPGRLLAARLAGDGVVGTPVAAAGSPLTAFPVR